MKAIQNMSNHPDKLTIEYCDRQVGSIHRYDYEKNVYKQLADTMRENEELKKHPLKLLCEKCNVLTDIHQHKESEPYKFQDRADDALELIANEKQNKHSDTSGSSNGRTADFDSANHGSSPCPESNHRCIDCDGILIPTIKHNCTNPRKEYGKQECEHKYALLHFVTKNGEPTNLGSLIFCKKCGDDPPIDHIEDKPDMVSAKHLEKPQFVPGSINNSGKGTVYVHSDNEVTSIEPGETLYPDGSRTKTSDDTNK